MEIIGKQHKVADGFVQVTKIIDNFGTEKFQLRYFKRAKNGGPDYSKKPQDIYFLPIHWKKFKQAIRKKGKE